jgi:hypothetical protein
MISITERERERDRGMVKKTHDGGRVNKPVQLIHLPPPPPEHSRCQPRKLLAPIPMIPSHYNSPALRPLINRLSVSRQPLRRLQNDERVHGAPAGLNGGSKAGGAEGYAGREAGGESGEGGGEGGDEGLDFGASGRVLRRERQL